MKTFAQWREDAANTIKSLSPYRVIPPLDVPSKTRTLIDPLTGMKPSEFKKSSIKKTNKTKVTT